jgi:Uma2 family endonuclease
VITALKPKTSTSIDPLDRSHIVLDGITWETFQALIIDLESQPGKRLTYDDGVLEIWMPLLPHESFKRWLGRIVEIVTEEIDCEIRSLSDRNRCDESVITAFTDLSSPWGSGSVAI